MSMATLPNLLMVIKGQVADALHGLRAVRGESGRLSGSFGSLTDAGSIAAGMLVHDIVRSATAATDEFFRLGGAIGTLQTSFDRLLIASGSTELSLDGLRKATHNMIADVDLLQAANQAMMFGLPVDELDKLYDAVIRVGAATGRDATQSINEFTYALGRQSPKVLDNFAIMLRLEEAYEEYAPRIGKVTSELTENERRTAFATIAMERMMERSIILGENISDATVKQEQWATSWKNLATSIGKFLAPLSAIQPILNPIMTMIGTTAGILLPQLIKNLVMATTAQTAHNVATAQAATVQTTLTGAVVGQQVSLLGLVKALITATAASWAHTIAEKARAVASAIAHGVSSLGAALPLIAAGALGATAIIAGALSRIPSRQFGGPVPETGPYMLHKGEYVVPSERGGASIHIENLNLPNVRDARDFVRKMRALGVGG